ncbi:MAG: L-aspartate oxidase [Thermoleophilia bacterium]
MREPRRPYLIARGEAEIRYSSYDVLVVGGGIAGLTAAVGGARKWNVAMLTKSRLDETTTFLAQGGIAAALSPLDSPQLHLRDTREAGAGLCDEEVARILVEEGPERVRELEHLGTRFDRQEGDLVLASEGAHSVPRVVRAGGDATGSVVGSALVEALVSGSRVELHEEEFVVDLLTDGSRCIGAISLDAEGRLTVSFARAVVLTAGGAGQLYTNTTNPLGATGDGHAMAYRAGALLGDMEFMQFHPTALHSAESPTLLLTEALRGEGAKLLDAAGERFMVGTDPREELAPRDVVVRRMKEVMDRDGSTHVLLDATHLPCSFLRERFPTVFKGLEERGYDLCRDLIPVSPASHYYIGGVVTDQWGKTSVPGLYAAGEAANSGVHGANRLASNSLLEGLVFGDRIVRELNRFLALPQPSVRKISLDLPGGSWRGNSPEAVAAARREIQETMTRLAGIVRDEAGLMAAEARLNEVRGSLEPPSHRVDELEVFNLLTVASLLVRAARERRESRGVHLRSDFPERDDEHWRRHLTMKYDPETDEPLVRVLSEGSVRGSVLEGK